MWGQSDTPQSILKTVFGYDAFRGHQAAVIDAVVRGEHAAIIMPTGAGKSLCYQIPAVLRQGTAVVVSPLIALMDDQVAAAHAVGIKAAALNSSMPHQAQIEAEEALRSGDLDLLFVAPERANLPGFHRLLLASEVALFAIDEAHCVSEWGHDFRPDYRQLGQLCDAFPGVPRIALTATADERTRLDILEQLAIPASQLFVSGFDRDNIFYDVALKNSPSDQLKAFLKTQAEGCAGIVYCQTRNKTEEIAAALERAGYHAIAYHAGLEGEERSRRQARFLREDGLIMVATVAFGMGINKPDVRFVVHMGLPKSIEAYYQETGRAGRDGLPAHALMLWGAQDIVQARWFIQQSGAPDAQKAVELARLQTLVDYCETLECRRIPLLTYFGDDYQGPCNTCDTCLAPPEQEDVTDAMRKLLSAVYRTEQRFGLHYVVAVLRGEGDEKISRFGHDTLGVFGLGKDVPKAEWLDLGKLAQTKGYLEEGEHRAQRLTNAARPVLKGEEQVFQRKERVRKGAAKAKKKRSAAIDLPPEARQVFDRLRAWRSQQAKAQAVPAYVIFPDATLKAIALHCPLNEAELLQISGVGQKKVERFGHEVLALIH
ncbi:MAG: DNA helicase RecQ [Pseudomonadota bacterium]